MNARTTPVPALELTVAVLREPAALLRGRDDDRGALARLTPALLAIVVAAAGLFGLVVGSYRGGLQHLWAALKLPLVLLLPLLVALPAVHALYRVAGVGMRHERLVFASLVGCARASLLLAAMGPALWLVFSLGIDYHAAVLVMCAALVLAGTIGLVTTASLLPAGGALRVFAHVGALAVAAVVLAQGGWVLRPFLVRPRAEITFLRPLEADVFSSARATWRSSKGDYRGWDPDAPRWRRQGAEKESR